MTSTRETMPKMRREELKNIAISYRIYNGYHERPISKMRKVILLILFMNQFTTPNHSPNTRETILQNATRQDRRRRRENRHNEDVICTFYTLPLSSRDTLRILMQEDE